MKTLIGLLAAALSLSAFAQPEFDWVNTYGGTSVDGGKDIAIDEDGNLYVIGEFRSSASFPTGTQTSQLVATGSTDIFIQKLDNAGNQLWIRQIGGASLETANAIDIDPNGDVLIAGSFRGTVDLDPGPGVSNFTAAGTASDAFVMKLNPNGNLIWVEVLDSDAGDCFIENLVCDQNGDVVLVGRWVGTVDLSLGSGIAVFSASGSGADVFVLRLDFGGGFVWARQLNCTGSALVNGLAVDPSGAAVLTGSFTNTIDLDPSPATDEYTALPTQDDMYVIKLNAQGVYVWGHVFAAFTAGAEIGSTVAVDSENNYCIGGHFNGTVDFDPGPDITFLDAFGIDNGFVLVLDEDGAFQWARHIVGDVELRSIAFDGQGGLIGGGNFVGNVDLDPGSTQSIQSSNGLSDAFLFRWSSTGTFDSAITFGGAEVENFFRLAIDSDNGIYSTGYFQQTVDFDPGEAIVNRSSNGSSDCFVHKLTQCFSTELLPDVPLLPDLVGECIVMQPTAPTATTNCGETVTGVADIPFPIETGTTVITWTFTDSAGNTSTQLQNAIVEDSMAPSADVALLPVLTSECEITSLIPPTATDNCAGTVSGTHDTDLPITASTTITWTYDDGNGNTSTQSQNVVIDDATAPIADVDPLPAVESECPLDALTPPTATDNCGGVIEGELTAILPIEASTTVLWVYDDGNGNTTLQTQQVVITPIDNGVTQLTDEMLAANAGGYSYQWVDCNADNTPLPGETDQVFTATVSGSYAVIIDNGECSVQSECFELIVVGVDEQDDAMFVLFPNPTDGLITVQAGTRLNRMEVFDFTGKRILEYGLNAVNAFRFELPVAPGVYFIAVTDVAGRIAVQRLVKR